MKGIRQKILLNTIAIVLSLAVVTTLILIMTSTVLIDTTLSQTLAPYVKTSAQSVESNLHMLADRIFMISDNETLHSPDASKPDKQAVLEKAASGIEFVGLGLYDAKGTLYTGTGTNPDSIQDNTLFSLMNETSNLVVGDTDASGEDIQLSIGVPLLDGQTVTGYLVGIYKYDVLNDVISNIHIGHSGYALIVNKDGSLMASPDTQLLRQQAGIDAILEQTPEVSALLDKVYAGETGTLSLKIGGENTVAAYSPVRGVNWNLLILAPKSDFKDTAVTALFLNLAIIAVMLLAALIYLTVFSTKISRSLKNVTHRIQGLAQGDISSPVEVLSTRDETQTLSEALRSSMQDIGGYIIQLRDALAQLSAGNLAVSVDENFAGDFVVMKDSLQLIIRSLSEVVRTLKQSVDALNHASQEVALNARSVNESSQSQADLVARLVEETDVISQNILAVEENVQTARSRMDKTVELLSSGGDQMDNTLGAMEEISQSAEEIKRIAKFIEDISFQTNILALNAGVEAARAGAAGKGFAVVAQEVRELAAKSAESSQRTSKMLDRSQKAIEEGSKYARLTAEYMRSVSEISNEVAGLTDKLSQSVESERSALSGVASGIQEISQMAQRNMSASGQVAELTENMAQQTDELRQLTEHFKLAEDMPAGGNWNE